ncbi:MAG: outer membrane protein assembly factor BamB [Verrucomicrobiales bacterium]|jgi:outer membrane protein assembly factor BamB
MKLMITTSLNLERSRRGVRCAVHGFVVVFSLLFTGLVGAQIIVEGGVQLQLAAADPFGSATDKAGQLAGAEMKTDSGSEEILVQAEQFVQQKRYDLASILWQRVIDESGDQVFTREEWKQTTTHNLYQKYRSVSGDIESTLASLPPEGLAAYRLKADGEARALMNSADAKNRESALAEVVRRFFLSKLGDEAAFELACLKLDRGEFLPAARLLSKIANEYPDPTVKSGEINLRLAAVNARVGDEKLAREILAEIKSQPIPPVPVAVIRLVEKDIQQISTQRIAVVEGAASWTLPQGGPARRGLMPEPRKEFSGGLIRDWEQAYELTYPDTPEWDAIRQAQQEAGARSNSAPSDANIAKIIQRDPFSGNVNQSKPKAPATDEEIVGKWKKHSWLPVSQMLMNDGKVYFKTDEKIVCCIAATGEVVWFGARNEYPEDPGSAAATRYRSYGRSSSAALAKPAGEREMMSFDDTLNQSMSIVGDKIMVVQGKPTDFYEDGDLDQAGLEADEPMVRRFQRFGGDQGSNVGRARENRLYAYHANNGKILWTLKPSEMMPDSKRKMAFAGSPVPYGSLMVVPAYEATSLWLFGLSPETGEVLWRSFLADEPAGQTSQNSPVRIAIDGGEAYVATGAGIAASVDAISGSLNWAMAYPRTSPQKVDQNSRNNMRFYGVQTVSLDGWKDETIIPAGNTIVFAASDFNFMAGLDRRTGRVVWDTARTPIENEPSSEYVLGVFEGVVCVAGPGVVRGYRLEGGRFLWERPLDEPSFARGMLTTSGIFIPLQRSILHISTLDGSIIETIPVEMAEGAPPLGNLYTDGENLFSAGFRQVHALRSRKEGETVVTPQADQAEMQAKQESDYEKLAAEARGLLVSVYSQLASVTDAASATEAGKAFDTVGKQLEAIAQRMVALGAPEEEMRAGLEKSFGELEAVSSKTLSKSIANVITVGEDAADEVLVKMVEMHRRADALPILEAFGIRIGLAETE